jgi:hypothetical protein
MLSPSTEVRFTHFGVRGCNESQEGGEALEGFTIVTTSPDGSMEPRDYDTWLEPEDAVQPLVPAAIVSGREEDSMACGRARGQRAQSRSAVAESF